MNTYDVAQASGGETYPLTYEFADLGDTFKFEANSWYPSIADSTVSVKDVLSPIDDSNGNSQAGTWTASVTLFHINTPTAAHLRWDAVGSYSVTYTVNGKTWLPATNGMYIDLTAVTNPDLDVRVTFTGGIADDISAFSRLYVYVMDTNTLKQLGGFRKITFNNMTLSETIGDQLNPRADEGAKITNGFIEITPDPNTSPVNKKTVEFWARMDAATGAIFSTSTGTSYVALASGALAGIASATVQINGVARANGYAVPAGWNFWHIELGTASNVGIRIGRKYDNTNPLNMTIFGLATYPNIPSNTYQNNLSSPKLIVNDTSVVGVSQPADSISIYAYPWSITTATTR